MNVMCIVMKKVFEQYEFFGLFDSKKVAVSLIQESRNGLQSVHIVPAESIEGLNEEHLYTDDWDAIIPSECVEEIQTDEDGNVTNVTEEQIWGYMINTQPVKRRA